MVRQKMRLIYLGSGQFGLPTLQRLCRQHEVAAVISQPDRPAGRRRRLVATPIAQWASEAGLPLIQVANVNEQAFVQQMADLKADVAVVIAFGQKLGEPLIEAMGQLVVNLHASLLPKYRGAAPIHWAVIHGDSQTGLSVIGLAQRMDAGAIYGQASIPIEPMQTTGELHDQLSQMGPDLVEKVLEDFKRGTLQGKIQDEDRATKAPKLDKSDGTIRFDVDAEEVRRLVHGLTPWPGARVIWVSAEQDQRRPLILHRVSAQPDLSCFIGLDSVDGPPQPGTILPDHAVAVRDGAIRLLEVQIPGGRPMSMKEFAHGHCLSVGDRLEPHTPDPS